MSDTLQPFTPEALRSFVVEHWGDRRRKTVLRAHTPGLPEPCWDAWELRLIKGIPHVICVQYSINPQGNVIRWCGREKHPILLGSINTYGTWREDATQTVFDLGNASITFSAPAGHIVREPAYAF